MQKPKKYVWKDGRARYRLHCLKCGRSSYTTNRKIASGLWTCRKCRKEILASSNSTETRIPKEKEIMASSTSTGTEIEIPKPKNSLWKRFIEFFEK